MVSVPSFLPDERVLLLFDAETVPEEADRLRFPLLFEALLSDDFPDDFPDDFRDEPFPERFPPEAEGLSGYREASWAYCGVRIVWKSVSLI